MNQTLTTADPATQAEYQQWAQGARNSWTVGERVFFIDAYTGDEFPCQVDVIVGSKVYAFGYSPTSPASTFYQRIDDLATRPAPAGYEFPVALDMEWVRRMREDQAYHMDEYDPGAAARDYCWFNGREIYGGRRG